MRPRFGSAFDTGSLYVATTVVGLVALMLARWATLPDHAPAGPFWYFRMVLTVQATSAAVSGLPSDHFAFGARWNVQVRPSGEVCQLVAKFGMNLYVCRSYCTSEG